MRKPARKKATKKKSFADHGREGGRLGGAKRFVGMNEQERRDFALDAAFKAQRGVCIDVAVVIFASASKPEEPAYTLVCAGKNIEERWARFRACIPADLRILRIHSERMKGEYYAPVLKRLSMTHTETDWRSTLAAFRVFVGEVSTLSFPLDPERLERWSESLRRRRTRRRP